MASKSAAKKTAGEAKPAKKVTAHDLRKVKIFPSSEDFSAAADAYFADCDNDLDEKGMGRLYSEDGLCLWLTEHNPCDRTVSVKTLQKWRAGTACGYLKDAVEKCYLRICAQMASDPRIVRNPGRYAFDRKQEQFGGYKDKVEQSGETKVTIVHGSNVTKSDFE